jgi:flagellar biosynthesis protein
MVKKEDKKQKQAAALKYDPLTNKVPTIVALGKGEVAERIIDKAQESDIPTYVDSHLAGVLNSFSVGDEIPPELYEVVAQILVFVSELDEKFKSY